jgi:hypothetical protein
MPATTTIKNDRALAAADHLHAALYEMNKAGGVLASDDRDLPFHTVKVGLLDMLAHLYGEHTAELLYQDALDNARTISGAAEALGLA